MKPKYEYRIIEHTWHGTNHEHYIYTYITTPYDLSLELADNDAGTPTKLWIGDDTYIEFESDDVEIEKKGEVK